VNCLKNTCLYNEDRMCLRPDHILLSEEGVCTITTPKYTAELTQMESDMALNIALAVNSFKSKTGHSIGVLEIKVVMTKIESVGRPAETIIKEIKIESEMLG